MTLAYIICKDSVEAEKISMRLLKKRLIACVNIFPIRSMYRWKKKIVTEAENIIIATTNEKKFAKVVSEVKKIHSYKIPCILKLNSIANKDYDKWAEKQMK